MSTKTQTDFCSGLIKDPDPLYTYECLLPPVIPTEFTGSQFELSLSSLKVYVLKRKPDNGELFSPYADKSETWGKYFLKWQFKKKKKEKRLPWGRNSLAFSINHSKALSCV